MAEQSDNPGSGSDLPALVTIRDTDSDASVSLSDNNGSIIHPAAETAQERAVQLLKLLRTDTRFTDAVIVVSGEEFPIHRNIIAPISPFFSTALGGDFSESQNRKLVLKDASPEAFSIVRDYAYGEDVEESLQDGEHAMKVWGLAHRYQIDRLRAIAAKKAIEIADVKDYVQMQQHAILYGTPDEISDAERVMAQSISAVAEKCSDFNLLSFHDLKRVISSQELVATEFEKFSVLLSWTKSNSSVPTHELEELFSHVRFQQLTQKHLSEAMEESEILPKCVLVDALKRSILNGALTDGLIKSFREGPKLNDFGLTTGKGVVEFVISASRNGQTQCKEQFGFSLLHWAMSAHFEWDPTFVLVLTLQHRTRLDECSTPNNFSEDARKYEFNVYVKNLTLDDDGVWHPLSGLPPCRLTFNWTLPSGKTVLQTMESKNLSSMNYIVIIRCQPKVSNQKFAVLPTFPNGNGGFGSAVSSSVFGSSSSSAFGSAVSTAIGSSSSSAYGSSGNSIFG